MRAAVSAALGVCESARGPSCIVGDNRRNVLLAQYTADGEQLDEDEGDAAPHGEEDEYPDV